MKSAILLLCSVSLAYSATYAPLEKTEPIEIKTYGGQAGKNIRSIGRSFVYQLMKKQSLTDYVEDVNTIMGSDLSAETGQEYAKNYIAHVGVIGVGIVLFLLLLISFLFSWCCCLCCNKSQKKTSTMSMWRMIWGSILIVLIAANVAGIVILGLSGAQLMNIQDSTNSTIDTLGDGLKTYLDGTSKQMTTIKDERLETFMAELEPLVDNAISSAVDTIKANTALDTEVNNVITGLNDLDTTLSTATTTVGGISTDVNAIHTELTTIKSSLDICKASITQCDADCSSVGVSATDFDVAFDPDDLDKGGITDLQTKISEMQSFGTPPKTLADWAAYVQDKWDNIESEVTGKTGSAQADYKTTISEARTKFNTDLGDKLTDQIDSAKDSIDDYQTDTKDTLDKYISFMMDAAMFKEIEPDIFGADIDVEMLKYAVFGLFVLCAVILGLIILNVLVGLVATVLGCCKVDDNELPTDRSSGCCGCLLMCSSYCSVALCALATLVAALLVTLVMLTEGTCKQYNDGDLLTGLEDLSGTIDGLGSVDISQQLKDQLDIDTDFDINTLLSDCAEQKTLVSSLKITKDTEILGFSIGSVQDTIDEQIEAFDVDAQLGGLDFTVEIMDDSAKQDLENNKDALTNSYNFDDIKTKLAQDTTSNAISDIPALQTKLQQLITGWGTDKYNMQACHDSLSDVTTSQAAITPLKAALPAKLDSMKATAGDGGDEVQEFIDGVDGMTTILTSAYIQGIVKTEANKVIAVAKTESAAFLDFIFVEFETTVGSCQPLVAVYDTMFNYTCDNILIHLTLLYCGMSLIGISLLFYMCVSRCLARYFIKFGNLHPDDEGGEGNGCKSRKSFTPIGSSPRLTITINSPFPEHSAARQPSTSARNGRRTLITSPRPLEQSLDVADVVETKLSDGITTVETHSQHQQLVQPINYTIQPHELTPSAPPLAPSSIVHIHNPALERHQGAIRAHSLPPIDSKGPFRMDSSDF